MPADHDLEDLLFYFTHKKALHSQNQTQEFWEISLILCSLSIHLYYTLECPIALLNGKIWLTLVDLSVIWTWLARGWRQPENPQAVW